MEEFRLTRPYLESLSSAELIKLGDNLGVDIPPELDRVFVIEEILEISLYSDESGDPAENSFLDTAPAETAPLPKQYNITFIEVMIRDPYWAFVFWEIKTQDRELVEKSPDFEGYFLKVQLLPPESSNNPSEEAAVFRIPMKNEDTAWYLGLSPAMFGGINQAEQNQFKVEFCAELNGEEMVLAVSNPVRLPQAPEADELNPLVHLSGYDDFPIIRNSERLHRTKRA